MPISQEAFDKAADVVEHGIDAANACGVAGLKALETADKLADGLRHDNLSQDALLDLLAVALMKVSVERAVMKIMRHALDHALDTVLMVEEQANAD